MQSGESEVLEFKESAGKKIHHEIAAFAHSDGGTILVGVSDRGKIVDTGGKAALDKVPGSVQSILPPLPIKTETISGGTPNSPEDLRRHIHS
ncbi:MAG TPA: ATP-binding protein [Methanoculleus sp.]|nr:ATP-binding protein [Methanoculleus sp.]